MLFEDAELTTGKFASDWRRHSRSTPSLLRHTLTLGNEKEFSEHARLSGVLQLDVYFADPYCAWQCGTNENTNSLLLRFFTKGRSSGAWTDSM